MADRTSAEIFGEIFCMLAENPMPEHKVIAKRIFQMSKNYDFSEYQMYADEACVALDVAKVNSEGIVVWPGTFSYDEAK